MFFLYLLSSPHGNMCGFYFLPPGYACHDLQWKEDKYKKAVEKLVSDKMLFVDGDIVLIKNFIKYNPIKGPKQAAGAANRLKEVPSNKLIGVFMGCLKKNTSPDDYQKFVNAYGIPYQYPINTLPIAESVTDTDPDTDPESDTETDTDQKSHAPYKNVVDLYNSICLSLPKVKETTNTRKDKIRNIWREKQDMELFKTLFGKAEESDFLSGRDSKWSGCGFDWLLNKNNAIKVLEGNYDNKRASSNPPGWSNLKEWYEEGKKPDE